MVNIHLTKQYRRFKFIIITTIIFLSFSSCVSTKSTIKNIDNSIERPEINYTLNCYVITEMAKDSKYGYDKDYPINVNFTSAYDGTTNIELFLNALAGPKGETISFKKVDVCCPFPSTKSNSGAGMIDIYEVKWKGLSKPMTLFINKFEKGKLLIPNGLTPRK